MKKLFISLIIIVCIIVGCDSSNPSWSNKDFSLTMEFSPSFLDDCRITILKENDVKTLSIDKLYYKSDLSSLEDIGDLSIENSDSLIWSKMYNHYRGDSVFLMHIEKVLVSDENYKQFIQDLNSTNLSTQENLKKNMLDGITIFFNFQSGPVDNQFAFMTPQPSDTVEYQVTMSVLNLIEKSIISDDANHYINELKEYF